MTTRFGDVSGTNGRGKPRQKPNAHGLSFQSQFNMGDSAESGAASMLDVLREAGSYGFPTLVEAANLLIGFLNHLTYHRMLYTGLMPLILAPAS